jgi:hypothetical protein
MAKATPVEPEALSWVETDGGYALALHEGKLRCRNAKGKVLTSVPKKVKETEAAEQLLALRDFLVRHETECRSTVEEWMLRSLPVPRPVLQEVWADPAWRACLEHAVVVPCGDDEAVAGFLRDVDPERGLGIVDADGETRWLAAETIAIPHPILLEDLDDLRELASDLELTQGLPQLFRETWRRPEGDALQARTVDEFSGGHFKQLTHAVSRCRTVGCRVRGGYASILVWEDGKPCEARLWIGADHPEAETETGELLWVDARERQLTLAEVGPVAYSEGMRMASLVYAGRVQEEEEG